jgi:plasmid stability protein
MGFCKVGRQTDHSNGGAKQRGRSTEEQVCEILRDAVRSEPKKILGNCLAAFLVSYERNRDAL